MLHTPPSFCKKALLLLQVPANLPSFLTNSLIAIPATASAINNIEINMTAIFKFTSFH